jgi:hypothetical protein
LVKSWGKGKDDVALLAEFDRPRKDGKGQARRRFRVGGSGLWGMHDWEAERPGWQPIPPVQNQNNIAMIRISFETRTDSEDPIAPNAWRREAAARLREIAKRIADDETMPLILLNYKGDFVGKAREISYRPEAPRQFTEKPPRG